MSRLILVKNQGVRALGLKRMFCHPPLLGTESKDLKISETKDLESKYSIYKRKVKEALRDFWQSLKLTWLEAKWLHQQYKEKGADEDLYSLKDHRLRRRVAYDVVIRFMPFFIIGNIPGGFLWLAIYVNLFPNSIPSQFIDKDKKKSQADSWRLAQEESAAVLALRYHGRFPDIVERRIDFWMERDPQFFDVDRQKMLPEDLESLCRVFVKDYLSGYLILNKLYGLIFRSPYVVSGWMAKMLKIDYTPSYTGYLASRYFRLNRGLLSYWKKWLLKVQLRRHMNNIRIEDRILSRDPSQLDSLDRDDLLHFAQQRGITITDEAKIKQYVYESWLPLSTRKDISDDALMWYSILRMHTVKHVK